jgi:6-pyruvoyltetrahydropterin/6-carboxytetrahydropterin synthase
MNNMVSNTVTAAYRYHDISCGHRVVGQGGKCESLHGHNYRIWFHCEAPSLDDVGRVIDFSVIKSTLCQWLEDEWDHKFLMWEEDTRLRKALLGNGSGLGVITVPFNPTAENMGDYLLKVVGPAVLPADVVLVGVRIEETRKCGVCVSLK